MLSADFLFIPLLHHTIGAEGMTRAQPTSVTHTHHLRVSIPEDSNQHGSVDTTGTISNLGLKICLSPVLREVNADCRETVAMTQDAHG